MTNICMPMSLYTSHIYRHHCTCINTLIHIVQTHTHTIAHTHTHLMKNWSLLNQLKCFKKKHNNSQ